MRRSSPNDILNLFNTNNVSPLGSYKMSTFSPTELLNPKGQYYQGGKFVNQDMLDANAATYGSENYDPTKFLNMDAAKQFLPVGADSELINKQGKFGNAMARFGGGSPLTTEQMAQMSPADLERYKQTYGDNRMAGMGKMLSIVGDALKGEDVFEGMQERDQNAMLLKQEQERLDTIKRQKTSAYNILVSEGYSESEAAALAQDSTTAAAVISGKMSNAFKDDSPAAIKLANYMVKNANPDLDENSPEYAQKVNEQVLINNRSTISDPEGEFNAFKREKDYEAALESISELNEGINIYYSFKTRLSNVRRVISNNIMSGDDSITGPMQEAFMPFKQFFAELSGTTSDNLSDQELLKAASAYLVPRMRAVGSGATSDFEANLYQKAAPSMEKTPEGNLLIANTMLQQGEQDVNKQELMRRWTQANGNLTGFNEAYADAYNSTNQTGEKAMMTINGVEYVAKRTFEQYDLEDWGREDENGTTNLEKLISSGELQNGQTIALKENGQWKLINFFEKEYIKEEDK